MPEHVNDSTDPVPTEPDVEADPGLDEGSDTDWSGEGGATPDGPATETEE